MEYRYAEADFILDDQAQKLADEATAKSDPIGEGERCGNNLTIFLLVFI